MLKAIILLLVSVGPLFGQVQTVEPHLDALSKVKCGGEVPNGFACAVFFEADPPLPNSIDIASVVGEKNGPFQAPPSPVIRSVSLILDGILYTGAFGPPLKRDDRFSRLTRNGGIPVRIDGDNLIIKWPDGSEAKAKIMRREKVHPNRPQPA